jgi:hypothetical protein
MTLEGAGVMQFRCASFSHAVLLAQAVHTGSENSRSYDESEKILLHKEHRKTFEMGDKGDSFRSHASNAIDDKITQLTEGSASEGMKHKSCAQLGHCTVCAVTIINDDDPGMCTSTKVYWRSHSKLTQPFYFLADCRRH